LKTDTVTHVSATEVARMLGLMVEEEGSQSAVAKTLGISRQEVCAAVKGNIPMPRKVVQHFDLDVKLVYVPKGKK
jgi:predicted transcriptional regulator